MRVFLLLLLFPLSVKQTYAQIISTYAGNGYGQGTGTTGGYTGDGGPATSAELFFPYGVAFDGKGNLYIGDQGNMVVRKVTPGGIISTVAGTGQQGFSGDSGLAVSAKLNNPTGLAFDSAGNMYICDSYNFRVRKVDTFGIITTIAGTGSWSYSGDGGPATSAGLSNVSGVVFGRGGNLFLVDGNNYRIRKINSAGIISTVAGNGAQGYSGDGGPATSASLNQLGAITLDSKGNMYIADFENHRVRKVDTAGIIITIAGNGNNAFSGDGGPAINAEVNYPSGITVDRMNNIYISDQGNRVRKIDTLGIITTIVGVGGYGYTGDGGAATSAKLDHPQDLAFDTIGNLYIADLWNNKIRTVTNVAGVTLLPHNNPEVTICPNPANESITLLNIKDNAVMYLRDINGRLILTQGIKSSSTISVSALDNSVYTMTIKTPGGTINKKLIVAH
jgi:sugar lactone lactonase YvrE